MPNFTQHVAQADSNIMFVQDLNSMTTGDENPKWKYPDWMVTGCFYSAVHIIEADIYAMKNVYYVKDGKELCSADIEDSKNLQHLFRSESLPTSNHYLRKQILIAPGNGYTDDFVMAYMDLEEMSHKSRYECYEKCGKAAKRSVKKLNVIVNEFNARQKLSLKVLPE
jgi:hypothetical protein